MPATCRAAAHCHCSRGHPVAASVRLQLVSHTSTPPGTHTHTGSDFDDLLITMANKFEKAENKPAVRCS